MYLFLKKKLNYTLNVILLFSWLGRMKKKAEKKIPAILKSGSKTDKAHITSYIRLFEPLVIKALKQYTVTSALGLQRQVLSLLAQLLQLHVNYCMLDSDQVGTDPQ